MAAVRTSILALVVVAACVAGAPAASPPDCGDVNGSGTVTTSDALAVLKSAVGQPIDLQCGSPAGPLVTGDVTNLGSKSDGFLRTGVSRTFTDNGDGTITDLATGLMWEKKDNNDGIHDKDNTYTWSSGSGSLDGTAVTSFLASLNAGSGFAGHKDWRLPTRFELETLVDVGKSAPSTVPQFATACPTTCTVTTCSCTRSGSYWTSTNFVTDPVGAWAIRFDNGDTTAIDKTTALFVRAVRAAN
jgi:hypothetical protein